MFLRSLRNRLALIFGLIVLGAIAIVSFSVTPQLESRLRDEKLHSMATEAGRSKTQLRSLVGGTPRDPRLTDRVREVAAKASAGVLVLGLPRSAGAAFFPVSDSTPTGGIELEDAVDVAEAAMRTRRTATTAEPTRLGRQALAATSLTTRDNTRYVVVLSDSFTDVENTVSLIRRQILVSGAIALVIASSPATSWRAGWRAACSASSTPRARWRRATLRAHLRGGRRSGTRRLTWRRAPRSGEATARSGSRWRARCPRSRA